MPEACAGCGAQLGSGLLICPACHRLVHARQLGQLAADAQKATLEDRVSDALSAWRTALPLLPPGTRQAEEVNARIQTLSARVDAPGTPPPRKPGQGKVAAGASAVGLFLWKFKVVLLLGLGKAKFLLLGLTKLPTLLSMFLAFSVYWSLWGWKFALGFVLGIYVHEMGHVVALRGYGISASAPMFIPGFGAFVRLNQRPANAIEDSRVGLAGPRWGAFATLGFAALYLATGEKLFAALAHANAWINVFNLLPFWQLDGSRAFAALARRERLIAAGVLLVSWIATSETLVLLVALGAGVRSFTKDAPATSDRRTLVEYALLSVALAGLGYLMAKGSPLL